MSASPHGHRAVHVHGRGVGTTCRLRETAVVRPAASSFGLSVHILRTVSIDLVDISIIFRVLFKSFKTKGSYFFFLFLRAPRQPTVPVIVVHCICERAQRQQQRVVVPRPRARVSICGNRRKRSSRTSNVFHSAVYEYLSAWVSVRGYVSFIPGETCDKTVLLLNGPVASDKRSFQENYIFT